MDVQIKGGKSFSFLEVSLKPGEDIQAEAGAMSSMDGGVGLTSSTNGGFFKALLLGVLGKESFFISQFSNQSMVPQGLVITQKFPGEVVEVELKNQTLYLQPGAFLACTKGIHFSVSFAGLRSFLAREGLFRLKIQGSGRVWFGAYGAVVEKEVIGSYLVDSGHLLSYDPSLKLKLQLSGGLFSSFFSGEGLVARLEGHGKIRIQTRSLAGIAGWLNPKFRG